MFGRIFRANTTKIILGSLTAIIVAVLLFLTSLARREVWQQWVAFSAKSDFIRVDYTLYKGGHEIGRFTMTPRLAEKVWQTIRTAEPGAGPKKLYDVSVVANFARADGRVIRVRLKKDLDDNLVHISFYATTGRGILLVAEDRMGIIKVVLDHAERFDTRDNSVSK